jgi:predicted metalloprotease
MDFNENARIDSSEVEDRRGQSGGGGVLGSLPGGALTAGGGGLGIVGIIIVVLFQVLGGGGGTAAYQGPDPSATGPVKVSECKTGADAEKRADCRITAIANSVQDYWAGELPTKKIKYTESDTVLFTSATSSGCGQATSDMGPFYCPTDKKVYLDLGFFSDMLEGKLGAEGGPFAEAYVVAHEYGHHVQDLQGTMAKAVRLGSQGATSGSVRLELQADCYAGVWGHHATTTKDADGNILITNLTQDDINRAIDSASAVGDDRIEKETSGQVTPESWTHGSSAQRQKWFMTGYKSGAMADCNTFAANAL